MTNDSKNRTQSKAELEAELKAELKAKKDQLVSKDNEIFDNLSKGNDKEMPSQLENLSKIIDVDGNKVEITFKKIEISENEFF